MEDSVRSFSGVRRRSILIGTVFQCSVLSVIAIAEPPSNLQSTTAPAISEADRLIADIGATRRELSVLLRNNQVFSDPDERRATAPQAIKLIHRMTANYEALARQPRHHGASQSQRDAYLVMAAALDDQAALAAIRSLAKSDVPGESARGRAAELHVRWLQAGKDVVAQTDVVDALHKLASENPDDDALCAMTLGFATAAATPELGDRLRAIATTTMTAQQTRDRQLQERAAEADRLLKSNIGKAVQVAGKTVDGKDFSIAAWKGKVVLVDFWATWCAPCVAQIPRLKDVYAKHHAQGLEIVGVSNDHDRDALSSFLQRKSVPWPQLFDPEAAADQKHHPIATTLHVEGIPQLFLIDRKGNVRVILDLSSEKELDAAIVSLLAE